LRGTTTVEGTGEARLLADTPRRDKAKIPCSMRPRIRSTSRAPGSVAAICSGVLPALRAMRLRVVDALAGW
jgi:hypothetical protein